MRDIVEVHYFDCTCSRCGGKVRVNHGLKELKETGWLVTSNDLFCPACYGYFFSVPISIGDTVVCLKDEPRYRLVAGQRYQVCDLARQEKGSLYVDVGGGWQAKLSLGEYDF